jgi:hypothetical protein
MRKEKENLLCDINISPPYTPQSFTALWHLSTPGLVILEALCDCVVFILHLLVIRLFGLEAGESHPPHPSWEFFCGFRLFVLRGKLALGKRISGVQNLPFGGWGLLGTAI